MAQKSDSLSLLTGKLLHIDSPSQEYQSLLNAKDFTSAIRIIETQLHTANNNLGYRLSWILCQLELEQVPVLALCSPLEEIFPLLQAEALPDKLLTFAAGIYLKTGTVLINQQKLRLAVPILENAFYFANQLNLTKAEKEQVLELLLNTIQEEITKAEKRRDNTTYIKSLEDSLSKFKQTVIKEEVSTEASQPASTRAVHVEEAERGGVKKPKGKKGKNLSAKSLLQDFDKKHVQTDSNPPKAPSTEPSPSVTKKNPGVLLVTGALMFLLLIVYNEFPKFSISSFGSSADKFAVLEMNAALAGDIQLPQLEPLRERHDPDAALGAIALKKVEDRLQQLGKSLEDNIKENVKPENKPSDPIQAVSNKQQPDIKPNYEQYHGNYGESSHVVEKIGYDNTNDRKLTPNLNSHTAAIRKVDVIERGERSIEVSDLRRSPDGRVYGPPMNTVGVNKTVDSGARRNIKSIYVEQFDPPVTYKTIVGVTVLSSPSAVSYGIADLPKGADIKVSATMGPWLEVISFKGRKGYIYTQDAVRK